MMKKISILLVILLCTLGVVAAKDVTGTLTGDTGLASEANQSTMDQAGSDLTNYLTGGLTGTDAAALLTGGAGGITSLLTGSTGLGSTSNSSLLAGSGASLVSSICGGMMDSSLVSGFISNAAGDLVDKLKASIKDKIVNLGSKIFTLPAWIHDAIFGTDYMDTGKNDARIADSKKLI